MQDIVPSVLPKYYAVKTHPVYSRVFDGYIKDETRWIIEVKTSPYNEDDLFSTSGKYSDNRQGVVYYRQDGSTLVMDARTAFNKGKEIGSVERRRINRMFRDL